MSKEFNFAAFVANFGDIIKNEIERRGGREATSVSKDLEDKDTISDEGTFHTNLFYIELKEEVGMEQILEDLYTSFENLFEKYRYIICANKGYIESCTQFEASPPDIEALLFDKLQSAMQFQQEQLARINAYTNPAEAKSFDEPSSDMGNISLDSFNVDSVTELGHTAQEHAGYIKI